MPDSNKVIHEITIVTQPGPSFYRVGRLDPSTRKVVAHIVKGQLFIGDGFLPHYLGYDDEDNLLFSINCMIPCVVAYKVLNKDDING